jgi:RNA polymerase sigma-70 factor (ECF subfamily)
VTGIDPDAAIVREAVAAVRQGNRDAFARLVDLYQRRLFGLALMMTREPASAEDVVQDGFVRAFLHLHTYDVHRPFYPWISTVVVRLAQNLLIKRARLQAREGADLEPEHPAPASNDDALDVLIADERDRRLWQSVAALSSGERTAVILYYRQNMTVDEIASAVGVSSGTVKTLLFRGRQKLRKELL